jgi:cytosine/creatinine deaminase
VITLPQTNLYLQGRDHAHSTPRGLTAISVLRAAGAIVAGGADNLQDPFNLVGKGDPLETAALLVMAGHLLPADAVAMCSTIARQALGLPDTSIRAGSRADLVVVPAASVREATAFQPPHRRTMFKGRWITS